MLDWYMYVDCKCEFLSHRYGDNGAGVPNPPTTAKSKKKIKQEKITDSMPVQKKKRDRFNGMSEEEVLLRTLPDHLTNDLDICIVSIV